MKNFEIGIRKFVENDVPEYWLAINAKIAKPKEEIEGDEIQKAVKLKRTTTKYPKFPIYFAEKPQWKILILLTILINTLITINFYPHSGRLYLEIIIVVHLTCLFYWIDVIGTLVAALYKRKKIYNFALVSFLISLDLLSLLPLSTLYLIIERNPDVTTFWSLRGITLLRFYRVPLFIGKLASAEKNHWKIQVASYLFYFVLVNDLFVNVFLIETEETEVHIYDWQETTFNEVVTGLYFVLITTLNIGYGDIYPTEPLEVFLTTFAMIMGFSLVTGVITAAFSTEIANKEKRRENCRNEFESIITALRKHKIDKKIIEKTSENYKALWKYKKGFSAYPPVHILPLSLRKELFYDINVGLLSRSLIFSAQPRSFLRSLSLKVINLTHLPGDIIVQPYGLVEGCIMISTGVIEVLSEENDETPILSFTSGTVFGETALFTSIPIRCIVKASTLVTMQFISKVDFIRVILKYPHIYASMRSQILERLEIMKNMDLKEHIQSLDENVNEQSRKKSTKRLLRELRKPFRDTKVADSLQALKNKILNLYIISENIPKVKTTPMTLIKSKPWILRPNTFMTEAWNILIVVLAGFVAYMYPYFTAFVRILRNETYMVLKSIELIFIADIFIKSFTAIERKDHFSYVTSLKEVLKFNLRKPSFYLDVLAAFDLTVYSDLLNLKNDDYSYLLLSLNKLLKFYRIPKYFEKLENNLDINLFLIRGIKYVLYFTITVFWVAAVLYLEACPDTCVEDRWFEDTEVQESLNPTPCSDWPPIISLYWASINVAAVGYGDLRATSIMDCIAVISSIIVGAVFVTYFTAQGSSTAKHTNSIKTAYQEQVFAVDRFMRDHNIRPELQERVRNYFRVQWEYDKGFEMRQNTDIEEMFFPQSELLIPHLVKKFLTVPLFRDTTTSFLRALAKFSRTRILPPNETIIYTGSFIKEMYILDNGYCEVSMERGRKFLLSPVRPIGYLEMIMGIPMDVHMKTVTHVRIICLDYHAYLRAVTMYPMVKADIEAKVRYIRRQTRSIQEAMRLSLLSGTVPFRKSRIHQYLARPFINVYHYHKKTDTSYWAPFQSMKYLRVLRFLLMPIVITPQCLFLKVLVTLRIIKVILIGLIAPLYFSLPHQTPELNYIIIILLAFTWIDMYLMFHIAYYNEKGILVFHPAKTAIWYLQNNFFLDLVTAFPLYLIINAVFPKKENKPSLLHDAPGFIMVLQYYKFYQAFHYIESDILRILQHVKLLKYIPFAVILTNALTGIIILVECSDAIKEPFHTYGSNNLEYEYHKSITVFCFAPNKTAQEEESLYALKFYAIAYYWVVATTTQCGFGDISAHNRNTMIAVIFMVFFGLFLYGYMFATLTGSMISAYNFIARYSRNVKEMLKFVKENGADPVIRKRLKLFYQFIWQRTEGAEPQNMLTYVHEALRLNILASIYDSTISKVPAFIGAENSVLAVLAKCMQKVYFLRGETIIRYNDIQENIYLVHRGRVDLFTNDSLYITSMETGGLFGNVSKKQFSRSSIIVIASKNVDAVRIDSNLFFKTLQVFPNTKPVSDYLIGLQHDYVEPIREDVGIIQPLTPLIENKETLPYEITAIKTVRPSIFLFRGFESVSFSRTYLYWYNAIYRPPWQKIYNFVIIYGSWLDFWIGRLYSIAALINCILVPYMFVFQITDYGSWIACYILDILFYFKLWLQFHYSYYDNVGNYVVDLKKIRQEYAKKKMHIFFDFAANFPLDFLAAVAEPDKELKMLSLLRLNRCLRFYYAYNYYKVKKKFLMVNKIYVELIWIFASLILVVHFFACIWIFVTRPLGKKQPSSWVTEMDLSNENNLILYIYSVYYIVGIITTTGFGDVKIVSGAEVFFAIVFMIICRFAIAMLAGSLAAVINVHSQSLFLYQERITELKEYFVQNRISKYQISKMWRYVTSLWHKESGKQIPKFVERAPHVMRCELMSSMYGEHLWQSYAFCNSDEAFLRQLSIYLKRTVYFPGTYIAHQGDIDHTMYFIHLGQISVLTIHANLMETVHYKLVEKDNFGLTQGLITGKSHHFTYRAESEAEILSLNLDDWKHLLKYFPEEEPKIYNKLKNLPYQKEMPRDRFNSI